MMVAAHFIFWFVFAAIWYAVSTSYMEDIGDGKEHCVTGTTSFAGLLMMSVETQVCLCSSPSDKARRPIRTKLDGPLYSTRASKSCQHKGRGPIPDQLSDRATGTVHTKYSVSGNWVNLRSIQGF